MFGIGSMEFLVIIVVAILVLGPEHLPKAMRTFSKVMSEFRRIKTDFHRAVNLEMLEEELNKPVFETKKESARTTSVPEKEADNIVVDNNSTDPYAYKTEQEINASTSSATAQVQKKVEKTVPKQRKKTQTSSTKKTAKK